MWITWNLERNFIKTSKYDKMLTCDGDDNIDTAKRKRRHAPSPRSQPRSRDGYGTSWRTPCLSWSQGMTIERITPLPGL